MTITSDDDVAVRPERAGTGGARGGERVLIALGGNAMTGPGGVAGPDDQRAAITAAMEPVADLVAAGVPVTVTHGNGPQVGNLLIKNELAAGVVPSVPLDWCVAQTQATIGTLILNALDTALAARGLDTRPAALVTRCLVDPHDPAFAAPSKPVGRYFAEPPADDRTWRHFGERGWRRVVASPAPLAVLDAPAVVALLGAGQLVVAAGGGGVPVVRDADGVVHGVEAVIDKDLAAAVLARDIGATTLIIATDVPSVEVGYGTPQARPLRRSGPAELRALAAAGQFAAGSMGPKVTAAADFVARGGRRAVITSLAGIGDAAFGQVGTGTTVLPDGDDR